MLGRRMRASHSARRVKRGSSSNNNQFSKRFLFILEGRSLLRHQSDQAGLLGASAAQVEVKIVLVWDISAHLLDLHYRFHVPFKASSLALNMAMPCLGVRPPDVGAN